MTVSGFFRDAAACILNQRGRYAFFFAGSGIKFGALVIDFGDKVSIAFDRTGLGKDTDDREPGEMVSCCEVCNCF